MRIFFVLPPKIKNNLIKLKPTLYENMSDYISAKKIEELIRNNDSVACQAAATVGIAVGNLKNMCPNVRKGKVNIRRTRKGVDQIREEIGDAVFKRAYRMDHISFWKLHKHIFGTDYIKKRNSDDMSEAQKKKIGNLRTPNGDILKSSRLSIALRWMAGGDKYDIAPNHGVHPNEVLNSVWQVVDAVNSCGKLGIKFPDTYEKQNEIAAAFHKKSSANFDNCIGCVDCMLVWTEKPDRKTLESINLGGKKFYCGRKKKFGLVLQATCDHERRFIDIDIGHPAATSDYLTFCTSELLDKMLEPGFVKKGYTLYGDNAYVNTEFMTTPFKLQEVVLRMHSIFIIPK